MQHEASPASRIGYVVKVYPRFSETFIVTEILAREEAGENIEIFALRPTSDARFHPHLARVQAPVTHLQKPSKLQEWWDSYAQARALDRALATRFERLLGELTALEPLATEVVQALDLAMAAQRAGITHLHAHFASLAGFVTALAARIADIPYTVTAHAKDIFHESVRPARLAFIADGSEKVVTISDFNLRFLQAQYVEQGDRFTLVRNGLDLCRFPYRDPGPVHRPLRVLAIGRLVEKKGFDLLVRAAAALRGTGTPIEVRIAGTGDQQEPLRRLTADLGLQDAVRFLGPRSQEEIVELLRWADVMAAPCVVGADGNADGLPTVLLEAMAAGLPCIAGDVTGVGEAVRNGAEGEPRTGVLHPAGDLTALTDGLRLLADPGFDRVGVARSARALVEREYDTVRQTRRLAALGAGDR